MERRDLLKMITAATGAAMIGLPSAVFAYQHPPEASNAAVSEMDIATLDEIAEIILPRTNTPGARDAGVGAFMAQFVTDCYTDDDQTTFRAGLADLDTRAGGRFMALTHPARAELLRTLDREASAQAKAAGSPFSSSQGQNAAHYFTMFKQLALFSFFTSEVAATQVLHYVAVPGYYDGDLPYTPGTPAWATN